jgi:hypothetical protein
MPTFNVLIATTGRPALQRMIDSLSKQLAEEDCLTIVYDGHCEFPKFDFKDFKCEVQHYCEPTALGYWGHGIRNKYASLLQPRDFVLHADDDDTFDDNVFSDLRTLCVDPNTLYIGQYCPTHIGIIPQGNSVHFGNISTQCGIIPFELNKKGRWHDFYGGDAEFYIEIARISQPVFLNRLLQVYRP